MAITCFEKTVEFLGKGLYGVGLVFESLMYTGINALGNGLRAVIQATTLGAVDIGEFAYKSSGYVAYEQQKKTNEMQARPDLHIYRDVDGTPVDLVTTTAQTVSQNPLNRQLTVTVVNTAPALAARTILMNESGGSGTTGYDGTVFIKSNLPIDSYSDDLAVETSGDYNTTWLQLAEKIRITRKIGTGITGTSEYKWGGYYDSSPIIRQDEHGKYAAFISDDSDQYYGTNLLNAELVKAGRAVELGLEKMPLALPLFFQSVLTVYGLYNAQTFVVFQEELSYKQELSHMFYNTQFRDRELIHPPGLQQNLSDKWRGYREFTIAHIVPFPQNLSMSFHPASQNFQCFTKSASENSALSVQTERSRGNLPPLTRGVFRVTIGT